MLLLLSCLSTAGMEAAVVVPRWSRLTVEFLYRVRARLLIALSASDGNFELYCERTVTRKIFLNFISTEAHISTSIDGLKYTSLHIHRHNSSPIHIHSHSHPPDIPSDMLCYY